MSLRLRTSRIATTTTALLIAFASQAAPVPFENTIAQRVQACTGCHGPQGRAASDGYYPRIAGKPAQYLYNQLIGFRDGRRDYALMTNLLAPLSDAYLREIAEHFASLDIPYPPPQPATDSGDALRRGEALVTHGDPALRVPACVACHGNGLMGVAPAVPALIGMPRDYLNAQLGAWRTGKRRAPAPDCMAQVAQRLAPQDIAALSQWLAAQPVPPGAKPAAALPAAMPIECGGVGAIASEPGSPAPQGTTR
ncbi:MAG TPA: c-type cytochrome [Burkholderiaceae bacterium]